MSLESALKLHDITLKEAFELMHRDYIIQKNASKVISKENMYIHHNSGHRFKIVKSIDGKNAYFGNYSSFDDAKKMRDYLVSVNWEINDLEETQEMLGVI